MKWLSFLTHWEFFVARRLNVRLLLGTLGVLLVAAGLFHGLHLWQVHRNVTSLLTYARQAKAEGKTDQALGLFSNYLKQVPRDLDAQEEFALALDAAANSVHERNRVAGLLETLLIKSGDRPQARARLIENLAFLGRYDAAVRHLEILRPVWPDRAEVEHKRGWCLDAEGKHEAAVQAYQQAITAGPKRVDSYVLLAEVLHHRLSRDVEANQILDRMIEANLENAEAYLARFRYHRLLGREAEALDDLNEARRIAPKDLSVILSLCQWSQAKGEYAVAHDLVAKGIRLYPANEAMIKELANLKLRQGDRKAALEVVEQGLKALSTSVRTGELQVFQADLLIDVGRTAEAERIIVKLRAQGMPAPLPDFLEGRLFAEGKKWTQAQAMFEKAKVGLATDPYWSSRVNALLGLCFGHLGDSERQITSLLEASRAEPRWPDLTLSLAQVYLRNDNPEQAIVYLERLAADPEAPPRAKILLARARYLMLLQTPEKERRWKDVEDALSQADKANPGEVDLTLLRGDVLLAQRKADKARELFTREIKARKDKAQPGDLPLWIALADLETQAGKYDQSEQTLDDALKRLGDHVDIRLARSRRLAQSLGVNGRDQIQALLAKAESFSAEDRARLYRETAELWLRLGEIGEAQAALRKAAIEAPRDLRTRALLMDLALQNQNLTQAREWLKEMQALEGPKGPQSAHAEILLNIEETLGRPELLLKILAELKNTPLRKDDGRIDLIEARVYERLGQPDLVTAKLLEAVKSGQRSPRVLHRLVPLLAERQQYDLVGWAISLLEGRGPLPRDLLRSAIDVAVLNQNPERVRELLQPIDPKIVRDYRELLWLGRVHHGISEENRAEGYYARAVEIAPHAPDAWIELLRHYVRTKQRFLADEVFANLLEKAPKKRFDYTLARCLEALGEIPEADLAYKKAIAARPDDFLLLLAAADFYRLADLPRQAETHYRKLLDPKTAAPAELLARARRGLTLAWSKSSPAQALEFLKDNQARQEPADERLLLYLEGLLAKNRAETIQHFEASLQRFPGSAEEQFLLAQLLVLNGKADLALSRLNQLLAEDKDTPQSLAYHARLLMNQRETDAAEPILQRLTQWEPDSPRTRELRKSWEAMKAKSK